MVQTESITDFLKRRLKDAGPALFDAIAQEAGVTGSFVRKFVYGSRENPRVRTIQPLLDYFAAIDRGERVLPTGPDIKARAANDDGARAVGVA
jgi:transcriptional regulator with XRE-family HTH domain